MNTADITNSKIKSLFDKIKDMPLIVFGSAATKGLLQAKDIDVFLDIDANPTNKKFIKPLRLLAYQYYGWLDPFVLKDGVLWVRNDEATGWIIAKNSKKILDDIRKYGVSTDKISS